MSEPELRPPPPPARAALDSRAVGCACNIRESEDDCALIWSLWRTIGAVLVD